MMLFYHSRFRRYNQNASPLSNTKASHLHPTLCAHQRMHKSGPVKLVPTFFAPTASDPRTRATTQCACTRACVRDQLMVTAVV